MAEIIRINIKDGDEIKKSLDFEKSEIVVGRDPKSDLVIDDIEISRKHLVISKKRDGYIAEDKKSTNGTFIRGKRIGGKVDVVSGDLLTLGKDHVLEFFVEVVPEMVEQVHTIEPEQADKQKEITEAESVKSDQMDAEPAPAAAPAIKGKAANKKKAEKQKTKRPTWVIILLAALAFIVIFCVIPFVVIEATNQWCDLFAGFFNSMSPGVCP